MKRLPAQFVRQLAGEIEGTREGFGVDGFAESRGF
jgi:hypothetical protein